MDKKSILEAIECHLIFGEIKEAERLREIYTKKFKNNGVKNEHLKKPDI